jgi:hypothetical protein
MARPTVFYAWQSDRPRATTRDLIRDCASSAVSAVAATALVEDAPRLDHDTLNSSGTPPISETIFHKIRHSAIFVADVTLVAEVRDKQNMTLKRNPNPNVMIELGFAAATIGWARVILVMNAHYGSAASLPFDLRSRRFPVSYDLGPKSGRADAVAKDLTAELASAIRLCLMAEYDLVDSTLSRLSSYSRMLMRKYGPNQTFWETSDENKVLSRLDLAVSQMLEADVLRCVDAATETGIAYAWTYLGQQCCHRLEVLMSDEQPIPFEGIADNVSVDCSMYDELERRRSK